MADESNRPVIIVRKKKGGDHGHHGGAWKVAYADFVTAMMAFFLLLWLLNVTTDEQKKGISDYFLPQSVSSARSGSGGVLGGQTLSPGSMPNNTASMAMPLDRPPTPDTEEENEKEKKEVEEREKSPDKLTQKELEEQVAKREQERFKEAEKTLRQAIQEMPELRQLAENLMVDQTPEGLRIQIVDQARYSMFPSGSAVMNGEARKLLGLVARVVERLPNRIQVAGHTDSTQFAATSTYTNWELSTDRANSSRRALIESGLPGPRITRVVGRAEQEPLFTANPADPRNRRISIILLRESIDRPAK